ncbi:MAG: OmpA family protein [Bacteroidales bacterium]|jgi:peptidoglycan-associated lipoprotein|nr:OmpA family protein [Bacteroidales bacterium]
MNIKRIVFLLLISLSFGCFAQKQSLTEKADDAFNAKQYVIAVDLYSKSYSKVKANRQEKDRILFQQSECYRYLDDKERAIKTYKRLVKAKYYTVQPKIYLYMADFQRFLSDWDNAEYNYKEYLKLVPNDELAKRRLESIPLAKKWMANPTHHDIKEEKALNTEWNDWKPTFDDNKECNTITFSSSRPNEESKDKDAWTGEYFSDIFSAGKLKTGLFGEPSNFSVSGVNTDANEGELIKITNGKTTHYYFSRCNIKKNMQLNCAIYSNPIEPPKTKGKKTTSSTKNTDNKDKNNKNNKNGKNGKNNNDATEQFAMLNLGDTAYNYFHPAVTSDELTIYFSSNRPGGEGDYDIWKATRSNVNEQFSNVTNLGKQINTEGKEEFPALRDDNHLYYSSDGLPGLGGYDIFSTELVNGEWTEPQNLKYPINTPFDEIGIIFNYNEDRSMAAEESGYFSSNREGGTGGYDIYSFYRAPMLFTLSGKVKDDKSMQAIPNAKVKLIGDDKTQIETRTNSNGEYAFNKDQVKYNVNYKIQVSQIDYMNNEGKETTVGLTTSKDMVHNFMLTPIPKEPVVLPEIRYDLAKWDLKDQYQDSLSDLLVILVNNPTYVIELASHTDSRPFPKVTNDTLSQRRAESVVEFLHARGIERERMVAKGYGDRIPRTLMRECVVVYGKKTYKFPKGITLTDAYINGLKTKGEKEAAHQLNRRTEFKVLRTDYVPQEVKDSLQDVALKSKVVDMVSGQKPVPVNDIPIIYTDNHIKITMIDGDKSQIYIILNGAAVPAIYDERYKDAAVLDWDQATKFLLTGRITKDDFKNKEKAFDDNGNILDNSVLTFKNANIGKYTAEKYEVIVKKGMEYPMIVNKNGLKDFGSFTYSSQTGEIIFDR